MPVPPFKSQRPRQDTPTEPTHPFGNDIKAINSAAGAETGTEFEVRMKKDPFWGLVLRTMIKVITLGKWKI